MTQEDYRHPIAPPPKLVQQWRDQAPRCRDSGIAREDWLMARAAQWGADQELEACCEEMKSIPSPLGIPFGEMASNALRNARRPKPPSLKEQALAELEKVDMLWDTTEFGQETLNSLDIIRRALEQLDG
jgi:hypothetical protein